MKDEHLDERTIGSPLLFKHPHQIYDLVPEYTPNAIIFPFPFKTRTSDQLRCDNNYLYVILVPGNSLKKRNVNIMKIKKVFVGHVRRLPGDIIKMENVENSRY